MEKSTKGVSSKEQDLYSDIPKDVLKVITDRAQEKTIATLESWFTKKKEQEREELFKNTKNLIKNYRRIKAFVGNSVTKLTQVLDEEDVALIESLGMDTPKVIRLRNLENRIAVNAIGLRNLERHLNYYKEECFASNNPVKIKRWNTLESIYLLDEKKSPEDIADEEVCDVRTVYKDIDAAIRDISFLLGGFDFSIMSLD